MEKTKTIVALTTIIFIGFVMPPVINATNLNATVDVKIKEWIGLVSPTINQTEDDQKNQSIELMVNVTEYENDTVNNSYIVDDQLCVFLKINDESGRTGVPFIFPRYVFYRIVGMRDIFKAFAMPTSCGTLLNRIFPIKKPLGKVTVVDRLNSNNIADNISIDINYVITNETYHSGENMTLIIYTMGFLPGDIDGLQSSFPVLDQKIVNLQINYIEKPEML